MDSTSRVTPRGSSVGVNSSRSPGWHCSAWQIASRVENRMARAFPVLRIERFGSASPIRSDSSVSVMRRAWRRSSSLTMIATSDGPLEVVAHAGAMLEHAGEHEQQQDGNPSRQRDAKADVERLRLRRDGGSDTAYHVVQQLGGQQGEGDLPQAARILDDERIAGMNGV